MRIPRFYVPLDGDAQSPYQAGQSFPLSKERAHYALTVLRLKDKRPVDIFDGKGTEARAILTITSRRSADLIIESVSKPQTESPLRTILLQGISKGDRMDFTIQKSAELGIHEIHPIFTEHCDVKLSENKLEKKIAHWQDIAINACEQSGRSCVPIIQPAVTLTQALQQPTSISGLVLDPYATLSLTTLPKTSNDAFSKHPIHILIGPEGGLSEQEVEQAVQQGLTAIQLGPRILRTETAGLTILSALQTLYGDF